MTESVGRHAAPRDEPDTLILPAEPWLAEDVTSRPEPPAANTPPQGAVRPSAQASTGRHASSPQAEHPDAAGLVPHARTPLAESLALGSPVARAERAADSERHRAERPPAASAASVANGNGSQPASAAITRPAGGRLGDTSALRLIWVYPDLLSTYGDRGNLLVLSRRARLRGIEVEAVEVNSDQPVPLQGDIYLLGGGEDLPQILAARRLRADGGLAAAAGQGSVVFAVCAGYQVIGHEFGGVEGEPVDGLGLMDIRSGRGERRGVGEIVADVDPALGLPKLTGFENHQGITRLGAGARPLARLSLGVGNGDGTEGAYAGKVVGTYLHGPALARNPGLADLLLSWVVGQLPAIDPAEEEWAARLRTERLAAVAQ
jgi:lipid II isoglutaminyl synthase (glutamine-hydrolysing)